MKLLAVDTATEACSVALMIDGACVERFEVAGREHSQKLPAMFAGLLAEAGIAASQIDGLAAGIGPGSFAGVRIGVSFVKGLGLGLDRPATGVSSLAMLAQAAIRQGAAAAWPAIDARMEQVYIGAYRALEGRAQAYAGEEVLNPADWIAPEWPAEGPVAAVGSGWQAWGSALLARRAMPPDLIDGAALPHARDALELAAPLFRDGRAASAALLVPNYLRNRVALTQREQKEQRERKAGC